MLMFSLPVYSQVQGMSLHSALTFMKPRTSGFVADYFGEPVVVGARDITRNLREQGDFAMTQLLDQLKPRTYACEFMIPQAGWNQPGFVEKFHGAFGNKTVHFAIGKDWAIEKKLASIISGHEFYASGLSGTLSLCICPLNINHSYVMGEERVSGECDHDGARLKCS